ncbi:archaetidylserine decarboxylase [Kaarinaea lacus]
MTTEKHHGTHLIDYIKAWPQFLLPHHGLCNAMHAITRIRTPVIKNPLIKWFVRQYGVKMNEAIEPNATNYEHFNAFFTRALKPEVRPVCEEANALLCPVDGAISQLGTIAQGHIIQAKGRNYSLLELIGGDQQLAKEFVDGSFITLYLSPRDYHRIHMPLAGKLKHMLHVPGRLFSVSAATTRVVNRLFARNERVVTLFENTTVGDFYVILVGALFVGSMETIWHGPITPPHGGFLKRWDYESNDTAVDLNKAQEMGRFNMGSTVILLFKPGTVRWSEELTIDTPVTMGQKLGEVIS